MVKELVFVDVFNTGCMFQRKLTNVLPTVKPIIALNSGKITSLPVVLLPSSAVDKISDRFLEFTFLNMWLFFFNGLILKPISCLNSTIWRLLFKCVSKVMLYSTANRSFSFGASEFHPLAVSPFQLAEQWQDASE